MTVYYGPGANGSGVAELIGYLNGVNYPNFIGFDTLLTKVVGVTFAVCAKLCIGKEGPLAHIGAICGMSVLYLPGYEHLRNDEVKRLFCAAGASTGVSVAFGAPIGGALFCYELSRPNTFWKFHMIWKVFFACALGTFTLAMWSGIYNKDFKDWSGAQIKFGTANLTNASVNVLLMIPNGIVIAIIGGILGAGFINVNTRVNAFRAKVLKTKWIKPLETAMFGFLSASVMFLMPYWLAKNECNLVKEEEYLEEKELY